MAKVWAFHDFFLSWPRSWASKKVNPIDAVTDTLLPTASASTNTPTHTQPEDLKFGDAKAMLDRLGNVRERGWGLGGGGRERGT